MVIVPQQRTSQASLDTQRAKAVTFAELHAQRECFVIANPWDAGSTRILTGLGFKALASTGAGLAFSRGAADCTLERQTVLDHLRHICAMTHLPVSADLESGFAETPEAVAETILLAASCGVVGGSIEDSTRDEAKPLLEKPLAIERMKAAVKAARSLDFPFTLTARAENYFIGRPDLADAIQRLQAYEEVGADVLFAPGLTDKADIATVLREIKAPLNVLIGIPGMTLGVAELRDMGVARISVGGSLARTSIGALYRAAHELLDSGTTHYAAEAISGKTLNTLFSTPPILQ